MKIIDLLNKIANGEEVPHVQYDDVEAYMGADGYLKDNYGDNVEWWIDKKWLNTEIEIIEENKKIEKCDVLQHCVGFSDYENTLLRNEMNLQNKINEIIDYLNKEEE